MLMSLPVADRPLGFLLRLNSYSNLLLNVLLSLASHPGHRVLTLSCFVFFFLLWLLNKHPFYFSLSLLTVSCFQSISFSILVQAYGRNKAASACKEHQFG